MHVTLRRAFAGALLAFFVALAPAATAQNDVAEPGSGTPSILTNKPGENPTPTGLTGDLLHDNGPLVNSPGTGPGGADESVLQTALAMTLFGFGHATTTGFRMADDFDVPAGGWDIDEMVFYSYQTGSTTTSTFTTYWVQIWDGPPGDPGSTVVFGDLTTNRLTSSTFANIYRRTDTAPGNTQRPVMMNTVAVDVDLPEGTYWVDWAAGGSLASGPWQPPITINGTTDTGNGQQFNPTPAPGAWGPALDGTFPQGMPFQIYGTALGGGGGCTGDNPVVCTSDDTPLAIPDNLPAGVTSTISVAPFGGLMIDDLDVGMATTHSWAGDLAATVGHGATSVTVYDRPGVPASTFGCSGDNPTLTMDDEGTGGAVETACTNTTTAYPAGVNYTPNNPLSAFDGVDASGSWTLTVSDNAAGDTGSLDSWSLIITPESGGTVINTYPSTDTPLPIADGTGTNTPGPPTVSTIIVPPSDNIVVDVDVMLNMTHSWAGDLAASLTHGTGTAGIYDRPGVPVSTFGCSGDNPNLTIDDEGTVAVETGCTNTTTAYPPGVNYTPNAPLTVFDGLDVEGAWVLTVTDNAGGDTGQLTSWAIIVTEDVGVSSPGGPSNAEASLRVAPNPMSATGTLEVSVPTTQSVRVAVFDLLGREVMVLLDRELSAAQRAVIGLNTERLGAGVYVVRATGTDFELIERVTIAR